MKDEEEDGIVGIERDHEKMVVFDLTSQSLSSSQSPPF